MLAVDEADRSVAIERSAHVHSGTQLQQQKAPLPPPADDIEATFRAFDADESGDIDVGELSKAMTALGVATGTAQASAVMARYDADRSGGLQLPEFRALVTELRAFMQGKGRAA